MENNQNIQGSCDTVKMNMKDMTDTKKVQLF